MGINVAQYGDFLKNYYLQYPMSKWMYNQTSPLLTKIKKTQWGGKQVSQPLYFGLPTARSRNFSVADAKAKKEGINTATAIFNVDKDYSIFRIDGQTIAASDKMNYAYAHAMATQSDMQMRALINNRATLLYGDGSTARAEITEINADRTEVTLKSRTSSKNLGFGMDITFSDTKKDGTLRDAAVYTITNFDRQGKKVTFDKALAAAISVGDYLFQNGDYRDSDDDSVIMDGLESFVPTDVPKGTMFRGVDISKDSQRLRGTVFAQKANETFEETILDALAQHGQDDGEVECLYMNPLSFNRFVQELGSRVRYNRDDIRKTKMGNVGFAAIEVDSAGAKGGVAKIYSDKYCPEDRIWGLNMSTEVGAPEIFYLGKSFVHLDNIDGNQALRIIDADEVQGRHKSYANTHISVPRNMLKINLLDA